jgi:aldehyde dehydrogenase (NAD+)
MENYTDLIQKQRSFFSEGKTKDVSFRMEALGRLRTIIKEQEQDLMDTLKADLNKSEFDRDCTGRDPLYDEEPEKVGKAKEG